MSEQGMPNNLDAVFEGSVYAKRPWLGQYPADVPAAYPKPEHKNLGMLFEHSCERWPSRVAFRQFGKALSYAQMRAEAERLRVYLQEHCTARDRVAIMLPNCLAQPIIFQAVMRANMVAVNVNPQYTAQELRQIIDDAHPVAIFIWDGALSALNDCEGHNGLPNVVVVSLFDYLPTPKRQLLHFALRYVKRILPSTPLPDGATRLSSLRRRYARTKAAEADLSSAASDDAAVLQYTGGTTGTPKGATLTHANLLNNVGQILAYLHKGLKDPERPVVVVTPLPLYHIFALMVNHLLFYSLGAENRLIANPRDLKSVVSTLRQRPAFNVFVGVNTLFQALVDFPPFSKLDFSRLRWSVGGGMQVRPETARAWRECTGQTLMQGYGLTEASPVVSFNPHTVDEFNGSIGLPLPGTDVMIVDEDFQALPFASDGELLVRGLQVMAGYWNKPEETEICLREGWLRTGDMARMDEQGFCYIVDRIKDIINVSGFKVYPNEIENTVEGHEGVRECACVGVLGDDGCEEVKIFVVRATGSDLNREGLSAWLSERLTGYKRPKHIEWVDSLAKTNVGKVLRRALREGDGPDASAAAGAERAD